MRTQCGRGDEEKGVKRVRKLSTALLRTTNSPEIRKVELEPRLHGAFGASSRFEAGQGQLCPRKRRSLVRLDPNNT